MKMSSISTILCTASFVFMTFNMVHAASFSTENSAFQRVSSDCNRLGEVNTDKDPLNIRKKPSQDAPVIVKAPKGKTVCILSVYDDNWYKVSYKGVTGYAASAYVKG